MAKMPANQWQQCHQERQSPSQQLWRRLHINGNDAIMMRATMPALRWAMRAMTITRQRQRCLRINDDNDAITTMAKKPASINMLTMAPIAQPYS
jgi:hypothetical protein